MTKEEKNIIKEYSTFIIKEMKKYTLLNDNTMKNGIGRLRNEFIKEKNAR